MVTHRSFCTLAITRITVTLLTLIVLPYSLVRGQIPKPQVPTGIQLNSGQASKKSSAGVVTDGFKAFDALSIAERIKSLLEDGPLRENQHLTSDIKLRVIVFGDAFIRLQYGLESEAFAELTISVQGMDPVITRIPAGQRAQIKIAMPANYGPKPRVASLYIKARTNRNQPANIKIYELAMERDRAPDIRKAHALRSSAKLATNTDGPLRETSNELLLLFDPGAVQNLNITPNPPTIRAGKGPPMTFSFTSQANYSGGRWDFWHIDGLAATRVWLKLTGAISLQGTKSGKWDGIHYKTKKGSFGYHYLDLVRWSGLPSDGDWTLSQTDQNLLVTK